MKKVTVKKVAVAMSLAFAAMATNASDFSSLTVFGDSQSDSGSMYYDYSLLTWGGKPGTPPTNPTGQTTLGGQNWVQQLSGGYGLIATPFNGNGTNYAVSASTINAATNWQNVTPQHVNKQITDFLARNNGQADPNGLYSVYIGINDLTNPALTVADMPTLTNYLAVEVKRLQSAGAQYIVVPNLEIYPTSGQADKRRAFSSALYQSMAAAGVNVIPLDFQSLSADIGANPAKYGFKNIVDGACTYSVASPALKGYWCNGLVEPGADQTYFRSDGMHLTPAGYKLHADYTAGVLLAPTQVSMLAETAVRTQYSTIDSIEDHLHMAIRRPSNGFNVWTQGEVTENYIQPNNMRTVVNGQGATGVIGLDLQISDNWIVGAAYNTSRTAPNFGEGRGGFVENANVANAFALYSVGNLNTTVVLSYGKSDYSINRVVPLGITTQNNRSETTGTKLALAVSGEYMFKGENFSHGPIAGVTVQRVTVKGFNEANTNITSMSFREQVRDSVVAKVGYKMEYDYNRYTFSGGVSYNQELNNINRKVNSSLNSLQNAYEYAFAIKPTNQSWTTSFAGVSYKTESGKTIGVKLTHSSTGTTKNNGVQVYLSAPI